MYVRLFNTTHTHTERQFVINNKHNATASQHVICYLIVIVRSEIFGVGVLQKKKARI